MPSAMVQKVLAMIETEAATRPSAIAYELGYQARVAMDRIRFAIKHLEQFCPQTEAAHEIGLQLLDALQRLDSADRRFQSYLHPGLYQLPDARPSNRPSARSCSEAAS
jgi:hypothetical protein